MAILRAKYNEIELIYNAFRHVLTTERQTNACKVHVQNQSENIDFSKLFINYSLHIWLE